MSGKRGRLARVAMFLIGLVAVSGWLVFCFWLHLKFLEFKLWIIGG